MSAATTINTHSLMFKVKNKHLGEHYIHVLACQECDYHFYMYYRFLYTEKIFSVIYCYSRNGLLKKDLLLCIIRISLYLVYSILYAVFVRGRETLDKYKHLVILQLYFHT